MVYLFQGHTKKVVQIINTAFLRSKRSIERKKIMKTSKRVLAAMLSLVTIFSVTACSGGGSSTTTEATTTSNTLDDDINNPVDVSEIVENQGEKKELENPDLTYFGFYDMRVAGDIKPGVKMFEETYGGKIDYEQVAWNDRVDKLLTLIVSDQSPDLVDKEDNSFPHLMSRSTYTDLTGYIDLSQPQWAGYEDLIEQYAYGGKHYYYPFTASALNNCLIYNKTLFDQYGLDDPLDKYNSNEWTWTTFKQAMIDFMKAAPDTAIGGIYGLVGNDIILSTGTPMIGKDESGKLVNNMSTASVERAANFLEEIRKEGLAVRGDGMWSNEHEPLASGKTAFLGVGTWKLTDFIKRYPDNEFGMVPFPRDEKADAYYYGSSNFGYFVPAGSKNVEGAAAFIDIMRLCKTDPDIVSVVNESIMNDKKYSQEQFDFLSQFEEIANYDMVINMAYGFNSETSTLIDDILVNVAFAQGEEQQSWSSLRTSYEGVLQDTLDQYNALLAG